MPSGTPKIERKPPDDDSLDELPPMDGDAGDEAEPAAGAADLDPDDAAGGGLDDSTGENDPYDPAELDLDENDSGWLAEPADNPELDLGDVAIVDLANEPPAAEDAEEPGVKGEDFGLGGGPEHGGLDAGDEGPVDDDEELREEDLPDLDADAEGDVDDAVLVDPGFAADEPAGLPWAAEPWPRVGAPVAIAAATAVACAPRGALAAGRADADEASLVRVDLEGTTQAVTPDGLDATDVRALAVRGERVAAIMDDGRVLVSDDGAATFDELTWEGEDVAGAELAWAGDELWVRSRVGGLWVWRDGAEAAERVEPGGKPGVVVALAGDGGASIAALVADDAGRVARVARMGPAAAQAPVREPAEPPDPHGLPAILAARGAHAAYLARRGVVRSLGGGPWTRHVWDGRVTALAFVDAAGTLVAATYSDTDDTTALVLLDPAASAARVVARIGAARADASSDDGGAGRVVALAYDDTRAVIWVAGRFGVAAYAVR
jgi:hypothetical protein